MSERSLRIRVGLFVLAGIVLLGLLSLLFSGFATYLKKYEEFTVVFTDAPGVGPGTPVRRSGIRIGQVKSVDLDNQTGQVRVALLVEPEHRPRHNDEVTLVRGVLGSDPTIDFIPRAVPPGQVADRRPIEPGEQIVGVQGPDVRNLLSQTTELVPSTQETLNEIRKTLARFEKMIPLSEETLREYRDLARDVRKMLPDLQRTNDEIQVTARNWGRLGERLDVLVQTNQDLAVKTLENANEAIKRISNVVNEENQRNLAATLKNVRSGTDNLESISKNTEALIKQSQQSLERLNGSITRADDVLVNLQQATKPMADRSATILKNLDESTDKLNRMLTEMSNVLWGVNQGDGTVRRLLTDPSLYNNLNDAACMLVRIMPRVDRILRDFEVFADKVARHPESLGVRGAVSPSSGLKEAPTAPSPGGFWPKH
jgi:phospholipid/cholesterol/gamma-HCH transport system substrate-binding protein